MMFAFHTRRESQRSAPPALRFYQFVYVLALSIIIFLNNAHSGLGVCDGKSSICCSY